MNAQANIAAVQDMYAAFGRGDVPAILDRLTDDVRWVTHFDAGVPWGGDWSGKAKVPGFFNAIYESVDVLDFEPTEFIATDDAVVSIGYFESRTKEAKEARAKWVFIWQFRDGKVSSYEQFHDGKINAQFKN